MTVAEQNASMVREDYFQMCTPIKERHTPAPLDKSNPDASTTPVYHDYIPRLPTVSEAQHYHYKSENLKYPMPDANAYHYQKSENKKQRTPKISTSLNGYNFHARCNSMNILFENNVNQSNLMTDRVESSEQRSLQSGRASEASGRFTMPKNVLKILSNKKTSLAPLSNGVQMSAQARVNSQPELSDNIDQIWTDHCLNKKPILAKSRKRRPIFERKRLSQPLSERENSTRTPISSILEQ